MSQRLLLRQLTIRVAVASAMSILFALSLAKVLTLVAIIGALCAWPMAIWTFIDYCRVAFDEKKNKIITFTIAAAFPTVCAWSLLRDVASLTFYGIFIQNVDTAASFAITLLSCFIFFYLATTLSNSGGFDRAKLYAGFSLVLFMLSIANLGRVPCDDNYSDDSGQSSCYDNKTRLQQEGSGGAGGRYIIYVTAAYLGIAGISFRKA